MAFESGIVSFKKEKFALAVFNFIKVNHCS